MSNTVNDSAIKKLKLLFTIVDRPKGEFYMDVISQFDVNYQMVLGGLGTARSELVELLGLEPHKAVVVSVIREELEIFENKEEKTNMYNKNSPHLDIIVQDGTVKIPSIYMFKTSADITQFLDKSGEMNCTIIFENENIEVLPNTDDGVVCAVIDVYKQRVDNHETGKISYTHYTMIRAEVAEEKALDEILARLRAKEQNQTK